MGHVITKGGSVGADRFGRHLGPDYPGQAAGHVADQVHSNEQM